MAHGLDAIFKPRSVAIIGASSDPMKFGNWVTTTALQSGFKGSIYLVNPRVPEVSGVKTYPSMLDVPEEVDLAAIIVPAPVVPKVLEECGEKGVKGAVIFSSGFREIGWKGVEREREILEVARRYGMRIVGPNCMGIYSSAVNLNITILAAGEPGNVGFITQSGGYGIEIFGLAMERGIRFSKFISTGDKVDLQDTDFLEYLYNDPETEVIMMYIEGVEDGRRFFELARRVTRKKPIFAIKIGRTEAGCAAAKSHTGAVAGRDEVYEAAFKQAGIIRAYDVEELLDYVRAYLTQPLPRGRRVGLLVGSGGLGCAAVDKCYELGLQVPSISEENKRRLRGILPEFASIENPVDFTASGSIALFSNMDALKSLFADPCVDSWFLGFTGRSIAGIDRIVEAFSPIISKIDSKLVLGEVRVPLVGCMSERDKLVSSLLQKMFGVTLFPTPERAIRALAALCRYKEYLDEAESEGAPPEVVPEDDGYRKIIAGALSEGRRHLTDIEALRVLASYGIRVVESRAARSDREAVEAAREIGYPVVMKILSPDILHKSDVEGVKLNINSDEEAVSAFNSMVQSAKKHSPGSRVIGVTVQKMASPGVEVMVGFRRDEQFGPIVVFGVGGVLVELLRDVSIRLAPVTLAQARRMVDEIRARRLLEGYRHYKPVDKEAIASLIVKVSAIAAQNPEVKEMDLNPVIAYPDGFVVVDAKIIID